MAKPQIYTLGKTSTGEIEKIMNDDPRIGAIVRSWLEAKIGDEALQTKVGQLALNVQILVHDIQESTEENSEQVQPQNDLAVN